MLCRFLKDVGREEIACTKLEVKVVIVLNSDYNFSVHIFKGILSFPVHVQDVQTVIDCI